LPSSTDSRIGDELLGYRLEALIGRGGMGLVYKAYDARLKRNVALKLIAPELAADRRWRERFLKESELAASIEHPNVVPIHVAGEARGHLVLAMRYISGSDLKATLARQRVLEPSRALSLCAQLAGALDAAHERGIVHRDVKPSNVLVDEGGHCYLADFGLTRRVVDQTPGIVAAVPSFGTPGYASPEEIRGEDVDGRADQYSLACLLFECLVGRPPYVGATDFATLYAHLEEPPPSAAGLQPQLPDEINAVFARALAKQPSQRYATCAEFVQAAGLALRPARRRRLRHLVAPAAVVAVAAVAVALALANTKGSADLGSKPTIPITHDSLQRIDPATNKLIATIRLPGRLQGPQPLAPGRGSLWVATDGNAIFEIDPKRNAVRRTLRGSGEPSVLVYGAGSLWAVNDRDGVVSRIDPPSGSITDSVPLPPGLAASGIGPNAGGTWVKASSSAVWTSWLTPQTNVVRIDPRTMAVWPIQIGPQSVGLPLDLVEVGSTLWSLSRADPYTSALYRVALKPGAVRNLPTVRAGGCCTLAFDGKSVWIAHSAEHHITRLDRKGTLEGLVSIRGAPFGVALGPGGPWVSNTQGTVSRVDPVTDTVAATMRVGGVPQGPPVAAAGSIWVAVRAR
jgi:serine/threonine protein kinase/streptogramin lyase